MKKTETVTTVICDWCQKPAGHEFDTIVIILREPGPVGHYGDYRVDHSKNYTLDFCSPAHWNLWKEAHP